MNKVFSFAKVAGICISFIMILRIVMAVLNVSNPIVNVIIALVVCALWIVFFSLLIKASAKRSPVVAPSWIAIVATVISFIAGVMSNYAFLMIRQDPAAWEKVSSLYGIAGVVNLISIILAAIAFFWLAKYFAKGSALKVASILIAIVTIIQPTLSAVLNVMHIRMGGTFQIGLSVFWSLAIFIPTMIFFFAFSNLKKA